MLLGYVGLEWTGGAYLGFPVVNTVIHLMVIDAISRIQAETNTVEF
jgi:hypothetical protein